MADTYVTNQGFSPVDTRQLMRQDAAFSNKQDVIGDAGFNKALGVASDVMSLAGPSIGAAAPFMGMKGAAITGAAVSAFNGGNGGFSTPGLASYGGGLKSLAMPGTAPGYPGSGGGVGGGMPGTAPGFGGSGLSSTTGTGISSTTAGIDSQLNAMQTSQIEMMGVQTKIQNISQVSQMMSNIAKTDSDAKLNAIRNIRS